MILSFVTTISSLFFFQLPPTSLHLSLSLFFFLHPLSSLLHLSTLISRKNKDRKIVWLQHTLINHNLASWLFSLVEILTIHTCEKYSIISSIKQTTLSPTLLCFFFPAFYSLYFNFFSLSLLSNSILYLLSFPLFFLFVFLHLSTILYHNHSYFFSLTLSFSVTSCLF